MGLFNKLKNVLFEEEEIEVPSEEIPEKEPRISEREKDVKKEYTKPSYRVEDEIMSDRELFKAEPTFNFPLFDEAEFESVKQEEIMNTPTIELPPEPKTRVKNTTSENISRSTSRSEARYEKKESTYKEPRKTREVREKKEKSPRENRKFTPSPVISPVYGLLDKSYKKEDVVAPRVEKKPIDVDSVRKKAFGTLEEDIEKTLNTPIRDFYEEKPVEKVVERKNKPVDDFISEPSQKEVPSIDDLLHSSVEDIIHERSEAETNFDYSSFNIEEESMESDDVRKELDVLDRPKEKDETVAKTEDTLENDLFDLIDSMYENREEGE